MMVSAWDKGEIITTLEMGGLGPGYEQAIQILVIELVREYLDKQIPGPDVAVADWGDEVVRRIDKDCGVFSGAQVGAAKWLAYQYLTKRPEGFFAWLKEQNPERAEQTTMVSRHWPKAPEPGGAKWEDSNDAA
jgi:hypothetical protein